MSVGSQVAIFCSMRHRPRRGGAWRVYGAATKLVPSSVLPLPEYFAVRGSVKTGRSAADRGVKFRGPPSRARWEEPVAGCRIFAESARGAPTHRDAENVSKFAFARAFSFSIQAKAMGAWRLFLHAPCLSAATARPV